MGSAEIGLAVPSLAFLGQAEPGWGRVDLAELGCTRVGWAYLRWEGVW